MPTTIKLSERFYRKFGHDLVDEMVNWFNQLDTSYRSELRELNDVNFARFDAKLEQRLAQFESKLEQRVAEVKADLIKWMFLFWVGNFATTAGLIFALVHFTRP